MSAVTNQIQRNETTNLEHDTIVFIVLRFLIIFAKHLPNCIEANIVSKCNFIPIGEIYAARWSYCRERSETLEQILCCYPSQCSLSGINSVS
jgi:hypothetical protein